MITTRSPHPPTIKAPRGQRWACHRSRPVTGHPRHPDGTLIIVWEWELEGKAAEPAPEPVRAPPVSRGAAHFIQQTDLFKD